MFKRLSFIIYILIVSVLLSGCWGQHELSEINLVTTLGIDSDPNGGIKVTVLVNVSEGGIISGSKKSSVWIGTATGASLAEALTNLNRTANKNLIWFHTRVIVIGSDTAKNRLNELADFLARNRQLRLSAKILIAEGEASTMLSVPADIQEGLQQEIEGMIDNSDEWSKSYIPNMRDFLTIASNKNTDALVGRIGYYMSTERSYSTNLQTLETEYWLDRPFGVSFIEGSSVLRDDKFVGFLNEDETKSCMWILNKVKNGNTTIIDGDKKYVLSYRTENATIKPEISGDNISINIKLVIFGMLTESTGNINLTKISDIKEVEKMWEDKIQSEISTTINKLQKQYDADVLGFGEAIKRKYPKEWRKIEPAWHEKYPDVDVNYDVKVVFRRFGKTTDTIMQQD